MMRLSERNYSYFAELMHVMHEDERYLTTRALHCDLSFRAKRKLVLISGAGIAGLAASFELLARGFKVVIVEKRRIFDRFNIINLDVESQRFLKKFGLLSEFEKTVAGRIKTHNYILFDEKGIQKIGSSDVSQLKPSNVPFEPEFINGLFNEDGIYSVKIKDLQNFLARKALEAGVHIFGNVETELLSCTQVGGVAKVKIKGEDNLCHFKLKPDAVLVAEGAHSKTAKLLGMKANEVRNECTGESWIFGNAKYTGKETFVVSMIDASDRNLKIANVIFNAQVNEVNIALTSQRNLKQELIKEQLLRTIKRVFSFQNIDELPRSLDAVVKYPVHVSNEKRAVYSRGNVFCIGDTAGHSSPLAGMGGTLGLTLVPRTIEQLINDTEQDPLNVHPNFQRLTEAYVSRWIAKSQAVKKHCFSFFKSKESTSNDLQAVDEKNEQSQKSGPVR